MAPMRKLFLSLVLFGALCGAAVAADENPFTGKYQNQVAFSLAQGVNSGFLIPPPSQFVPFYIMNFQYSQPTTFFRLPARQSITVAQTMGFGHAYGWDWTDFTIPLIYISEDIALYSNDCFYVAAGAGVGLQGQQNDRIGSKLLFQFKLTGGYRINDKTAVELFIQHFSNANTAPANYSYGFYGVGLTYNF